MTRMCLLALSMVIPLAACGSPSPTPYESGYRTGFSEGYRSGFSGRSYRHDRSTAWSGDYGASRRRGVQPPSDY
jgi:hypothetical protein